MPEPICVRCSKKNGKVKRMHCVKTGEVLPYGEHLLIDADIYECSRCGNQIATGFGPPRQGTDKPTGSFKEVKDF